MRKLRLSMLLAGLSIPAAVVAQFPGVDLTGTVSATAGAPVSCESCGDLGVQTTVGIQIRDRIGIGYRGLRWGDQSLVSDHQMATDLIALDFFLPTTGRVRPFLSGGGGHSRVNIKRVSQSGPHSYSNYGPATSLRTTFVGAGLDVRIVGHVSLVAMLSSTDAGAAGSPAETCTQYGYLSGDFTPTCTPVTGQKYAMRGLSLGIGVR